MTTTFCDLIPELASVIKDTSVNLMIKIDELKGSVDKLSLEFKEVKAVSEHTMSKLEQVETGMAGMDLPAYTRAILELAQM